MKVKNKIITLVLALVMLFVVTSCQAVVNGSKITNVTMVLDFYKEDGTAVATTARVKLQLYENNAPKTVAHIKNLIKKGYYNGVCVNNIGYEQFVELGEYVYDTDGTLKQKDYSYGTVDGEFDANGFTGQNQPINAGAIALKRNRGNGAINHNSGTRGLYFLNTGLSDITERDYCFIGRVVSTDGDDGVTSAVNSVANPEETDRNGYTSFRIMQSLKDFREKTAYDSTREKEVTTTMYYNSLEGDNGTYYKKEVIDGETTIYKQNATGGYDALSETEKTEFLDKVPASYASTYQDDFYSIFTLPTTKIIVREMKIDK